MRGGMSLYARLALWLGASLALLVLLHGIVTERAPRLTTEDYIATRLEHDAEWLDTALHVQQGRAWLDERLIPPIYQRPGSGHYYTLYTQDGLLHSASSLGHTLPKPANPGISHAQVMRISPAEPQHASQATPAISPMEALLILRRDRPDGSILVLAESLDDLQNHLTKFRWRFIAISTALFLLLLAGQFLLLRWLLRPLKRLEQDLGQLERGTIARLPRPALIELRPLVDALNRLIERQTRRLERSRNALADLAHALKTPLAALRQSLLEAPDPLARQALDRMEEIIQRELRHARWQGEEIPGLVPIAVIPELEKLIATMRRIHPARRFTIEAGHLNDLQLRIDREDLLELFGNLLDNAGKWSRQAVHLALRKENNALIADIEDDGPGADIERLNNDISRGQRLDESHPGHGLGLAIVKQILKGYGWKMQFSKSTELGGLKVSLQISLK